MAKANKTKKTTVAEPATSKAKPRSKPKPLARKPVKVEQTSARAITDGDAPIARPRITDPLANSDVTPGDDVNVTVAVNIGNVRYRVQLSHNEAVPWEGDASAIGAEFTITIPGENLETGRTFRLRVLVHPDDGPTPPNLDHVITITTTADRPFAEWNRVVSAPDGR